jgi:MPBQ/MSBQ methyltransferase
MTSGLAEMINSATIKNHWNRQGLGEEILRKIGESGRSPDSLTIDEFAPFDQFHGGGKDSTMMLARLAHLERGMRVVDVGGGLGGPARTLAALYGCSVTTLDLTDSYVEAAALLTKQLGLSSQVVHQVGDALALPFEDSSFDVVWTQNSGMNIADKERLYEGFCRVLRKNGLVVLQEPMAGPVCPLIFPVMWANDESASFLRTPEDMRAVMERAGLRVKAWKDVTEELAAVASAPDPGSTIQGLVAGKALGAITEASRRNRVERRIVAIHAVLEKSARTELKPSQSDSESAPALRTLENQG